jgi:hypothetical protein
MSAEGIEPAIPAVRLLQTYSLDRKATEIGDFFISLPKFLVTYDDLCNIQRLSTVIWRGG